MKVKVYRVFLKESTVGSIYYYVDAPNKRIARWCGANLYNNEYMGFRSAKDFTVTRFTYEECECKHTEKQ